MGSRSTLLGIITILILAASLAGAQTVYDAHAMYSGTQGTTPGTWRYKEYELATATDSDMTYVGPYWLGTGINVIYQDAYDYWQVPTATHDAVRQWEAPAQGWVGLTAYENVRMYFDNLGGNGITIRIYRNDQLMFENGVAANDTTGWALSAAFGVDQGDIISFHCNANGEATGDICKFDPVITLLTGISVTQDSYTDWSGGTDGQPCPAGGINGWNYYQFDTRTDEYSPLVWQASSNIWKGTEQWGQMQLAAWLDPDEIRQGPANYVDMVRFWIAPAEGTVTIENGAGGNVRMPYNANSEGDGAKVLIYRNFVPLWQKDIAKNDDVGFSLDNENLTIKVNTNDFLLFHTNCGVKSGWDTLIFDPKITWDIGAGYDPLPDTWANEDDFDADSSQGYRGWTYEYYTRSTETYSPMTVTGSDSRGLYWGHPNDPSTYCRTWADVQHPSTPHDATRVWTAPEAGEVVLKTLRNLAKTQSGGDPVRVIVRKEHNGEWTDLWEAVISDTTGMPLGMIIPVMKDDKIAIHTRQEVSSQYAWYVTVDLELTLYPNGAPAQTLVDDEDHDIYRDQYGDVVISQDTFWFNENHEIAGNLIFRNGATLYAHNCTISLLNDAKEKEFNYYWDGGDLNTYMTTIGGNRKEDGTVLHSNFRFNYWMASAGRYIYGGDWDSVDTTVRFTYGQLLSNNSTLTGLRHNVGEHSDLVHLDYSGAASLTDSIYNVALHMNGDVGGTSVLNLPINTPITDTYPSTTNTLPGAGFTLDLVNTVVPSWQIFLSGIDPYSPANTMLMENADGISCNVSFNNMSGTISPILGDLDPYEYVDLFNVRWQAGAQGANIKSWGLYFSGSQNDVFIQGPTNIPEFMAYGGTTVLEGTEGVYPFDAISQATVIYASNAGTNMELRNCQLGKSWTPGEILAENGATIVIEHADMDNPIVVAAYGGTSSQPSTVIMRDVQVDPADLTLKTSGYGQIIQEPGTSLLKYDFTTSTDSWQNWQQGQAPWYEWGFDTTYPSWTSQPVSGETGNGALHLEYRTLPLPDPTPKHLTRIVAPGSYTSWPELGGGGDLYLIIRASVVMDSPRVNAAQEEVVTAHFAAKDASGWSSVPGYTRQFELLANVGFVQYIININDPTDTDPVLTPITGGGTVAPLANDVDMWRLQFNEAIDDPYFSTNSSVVDYVDLDYVVITDNYRGWVE